MYAMGEGVPQNDAEAVKWLRMATAQDQATAAAYYRLGIIYADTSSALRDDAEAARCLRKVAEQGLAEAQVSLGTMYYEGRGVPKDNVQAHMWANLAATQGNKNAIKGRDFLEKSMTPAQLAEAQRLAREWTPKGK